LEGVAVLFFFFFVLLSLLASSASSLSPASPHFVATGADFRLFFARWSGFFGGRGRLWTLASSTWTRPVRQSRRDA